MANIKSQIKRNRSNERRRLRNQGVRSELKTRVKTASTALLTPRHQREQTQPPAPAGRQSAVDRSSRAAAS